MRRGSIVIIAQRGVYEGKPRPAVIIQAEALLDHPSVLVCLIGDGGSDGSRPFYRVPLEPSPANGLRKASVIMVDKIVTIRKDRLRQEIGQLDVATLGHLNGALALFQGLT